MLDECHWSLTKLCLDSHSDADIPNTCHIKDYGAHFSWLGYLHMDIARSLPQQLSKWRSNMGKFSKQEMGCFSFDPPWRADPLILMPWKDHTGRYTLIIWFLMSYQALIKMCWRLECANINSWKMPTKMLWFHFMTCASWVTWQPTRWLILAHSRK